MENVQPGDPKLGGDTIYLCVVDKDRNCVSLINSNYQGFGSGHVPGDLGFALQNRGTSFALDSAHANRLQPHKRPFHTIIPAMATRDGKPWFTFGVMGGDMQPQGHVQILCNILDFGMNVAGFCIIILRRSTNKLKNIFNLNIHFVNGLPPKYEVLE